MFTCRRCQGKSEAGCGQSEEGFTKSEEGFTKGEERSGKSEKGSRPSISQRYGAKCVQCFEKSQRNFACCYLQKGWWAVHHVEDNANLCSQIHPQRIRSRRNQDDKSRWCWSEFLEAFRIEKELSSIPLRFMLITFHSFFTMFFFFFMANEKLSVNHLL